MKFDTTDKIEVNTVTINKVIYMTHWQENELYWNIRFAYKIKHWLSVLRLYILSMGMPRRMRIEQLKSCFYVRLNVQQNDQSTNKMENKHIKCRIVKWYNVIELFWNKYVQKNVFQTEERTKCAWYIIENYSKNQKQSFL